MLKIGYMDYANVYPIFHYLLKEEGLEFKKGFPAELNAAMRKGEIDVSPSSSVEFARNPELYGIISGISVSSKGPVKSVNIFSDFPPEELGGKKLYFTKESNTSTVLCRIILEKFYKVFPDYQDEAASAQSELLIGDKALYKYYNSPSKYIIDLGEEWRKFTGLPFVFALWIAGRKSNPSANFSGFGARLREYAEKSVSEREGLAERYIERGYTLEQMKDYWNTIDYRLTDEHMEGLSLFYRYAYELGETKSDASGIFKTSFID